MKKVLTLKAVIFLLVGAIASYTQSQMIGAVIQTNDKQAVAIINVNVIPMDSERILKNQTIVVKNDRIAEIGAAGKVKIPQGAKIINGTNQFLMPGLADMHVHIRDKSELISYLAHGVTSILNMRGNPEILQLRKNVASGKILSPNVYTTGPLVDGDPPIWSGSGTVVVKNAEEAKRAVAEQKQQGYDFVKVYNRLSPETYDALMDTAKQNEIGVVGHIPREVGAERALEKGQAMIAHSEEFFFTYFSAPRDSDNKNVQQYKPDYDKIPVIAAKTLKAGTALTPNLSFVAMTKKQLEDFDSVLTDRETKYLSENVLEMWKSSNPTKRRDLKAFTAREKIKFPFVKSLTEEFSDAGVLLLLGTDSSAPGMFPGKSAHTELQELVDAGLTPYQALASGTRNAGEFINKYVKNSEPFGTIAIGQRADLVLLNKNPLENINAVESTSGVMVRGHWISASELQKKRREMLE